MMEYSLEWYLKQAEAVICKWGDAWMLGDIDNIGLVSYYMMVADQKYDPSRGAKRSTWRVLRGIYATKTIRANRKRKGGKETSLNAIVGHSDSGKTTEIGSLIPNKETEERISVTDIAARSNLTEKQSRYVKKYLSGKKMVEIAEEEGICKQAVSYVISSAVEKMRRKVKYE